MIIRTLENFRFVNESNEYIFSTDDFTFLKKSNCFSAEISELQSKRIPYTPAQKTITLKNPKTGNQMTFNWYKTDMDGSGEDTYGWRYKDNTGTVKVLIVND